MTKNNLSKNTENFETLKLDWKIIQKDMKNMLGEDIYESWLKKINFEEEFQNYVLLSVTTRFIRDWIASRYLDQILQIVKTYKNKINRIEFRIKEKDETVNKNLENQNNDTRITENVSFIKDSYLQYNRIDPNKKFSNFIIGDSNKLAFEASKKSIRKHFT